MSSPTNASPTAAFESCIASFSALDPAHADKPSQVSSTTNKSCVEAIKVLYSMPNRFQYFRNVTISQSATQPTQNYPVLGKEELLCLLHLHKLPEQKAIEVCLSHKK